jgi:hypothetical protein
MLNASKIPDDATVASKWSQPPQMGRNTSGPASARTVNYTPTNFPALRKNRKEKTGQNGDTTEIATTKAHKKENINNINNTSTHSNASTTSVGTTFTKEDGQSLFTSLTESLIDDMKSQSAQQNQTISDHISSQVKRDEEYRKDQLEQRKEEAEMRKEAAEVRREQALQFSQLLSLLIHHHMSRNTPPEEPTQMMDTSPTWETPTRRSMDTDSEENQEEKLDIRTPRYTAREWAHRQFQSQPDSDSSEPSSDTNSNKYDVYNRQGRRITELTIEEQAYYAAESASEDAAAALTAITKAEITAATATAAADAVTKATNKEPPQEFTQLSPAKTETEETIIFRADVNSASDTASSASSARSRSRSPVRTGRTRDSRRTTRTKADRKSDKKRQQDASTAFLEQRISEYHSNGEEPLTEQEIETRHNQMIAGLGKGKVNHKTGANTTGEKHTKVNPGVTNQANERSYDSQSYGTVDSQDTTHEHYEKAQHDSNSSDSSHLDTEPGRPSIRPDTSDEVIPRQSPNNLDEITRNHHYEQMYQDLESSAKAQDPMSAQAATTLPPLPRSPIATPEQSNSRNTTVKQQQQSDHKTPPWQVVVSATKHKAKVSPGTTLQCLGSLRKPDKPRTIKKPFQPRDSDETGAAGQEK